MPRMPVGFAAVLVTLPGALPGAANSANTFITFEAFKVYGGKIHAAEAILETLPIGAPAGW